MGIIWFGYGEWSVSYTCPELEEKNAEIPKNISDK
jgi:hypothetical protein